MTDKETRHAWMGIRKKGRLRILAVILSFCVLFTAYPNMQETIFVFAAEEAAGTEEPYVTAGEGGSAEESGPSDSKPGDTEHAGGTKDRDTEPAGETEDSDTGTVDGQDAQPEEGKAAEETDDTAVTDGGDEADTEAEEDGAGELTEEQQAQIPEEAVAKLMAWVELAETAGERVQVMAAAHIHDGGVTFDKVLTAAGGELESGNYYLTGNVALENTITIPSGVEVNLCLNGNTLNGPGAKAAITLNGTLNVYDCSGGGVLSGDSVGGTAAIAISLTESGGIFNLYGGKITGGAGTVITETKKGNILNLFSGIVEGSNTNGSYPINNWGTVLISGDAVVSGAGTGTSSCAVMNNGADAVLTVRDNACLSGAGHGVRNEGTVNIEGGTITGERYGVYMMNSTAILNLSGSPTVSGKTADLYLRTDTGVALDNAKVDAGGYTGGKLTVKELSPSGKAGSYAIRTGEGNKDKFTLTYSGWRYLYKEGGLVLDQHTHSCTYAVDGNVITESCSCGHEETATLSLQSGADLTYTGSAVTPVSVTYSGGWAGTGTNKPSDSNIVYTDNTNVGTAKAELAIGGATAAVTFQITEADMTDVTASGYTGAYDGSAHGITVTVPADATVKYGTASGSCTQNASPAYTNVGTYTVYYQVTKTNYKPVTGSAKVIINARSISDAAVTLDNTTLTYNGSVQTKGVSKVTVTADGKILTLTAGTDYTISDNQGTDAKSYTMTLTGKGNYTGTKTVTFTIAAKPLADSMVTVAAGPHYYTGNAVTPAVTVKDGDRTLAKDTDYTVSYENNTNAGEAAVMVEGKGNYTGTASQTFTIQYGPLPAGKKLTDYVTVSSASTEGWYGAEIILTPKSGCGVGEMPSDIGSTGVTVSGETGTDGTTKTIYVKDEKGIIYQTEFPYKLDKTPPVIDLSRMSVTNGTKGLINWIIGKKNMVIRIPEADVTDALSGIKEVTYTATPDNGAQQSQTIQAQGGSYEISLNAEFSGIIKLTAKDKADNVKEVSLTAADGKVIAEDYAPVVTITLPDMPQPNANGWYHTAVTLTVAATDHKDSGNNRITSGGIAKIKWKDGENGAEQTVTGLPGTAPVYEKRFTIIADTDGTHTYYVQATDNAGNVSGWQTVTVRLDTVSPEFSQNVSVTNRTQEGADITFTPSEGGKAYWIVSDTETVPDAQAVVTGAQKDAGKGGVRDVAGSTPDTVTVTGLTSGKNHTVYMVLEDAAGNLSEVKEVNFTTLQKAPEITLNDLTIDHEKGTIKISDGIGEVEVYTDPDNPSDSKIQPEADGSLPVEPGTTVYVRYPQKEQDGETTPASDAAKIDIPGRPAAPAPKQTTVTDTTVTVIGSSAGEEYILVEKGTLPDGAEPDWDNADKVNDTGAFTGLDPNKEYDLYVRKKATEDDFASASAKTPVRTHVAIDEPKITGDGAGKPGNTAPRPDQPDEGGATVTYTGTYGEEYTLVIIVDGKEIIPGTGTPGTEGSEMNWDEEAGKGGWKYVYPVPDGVTEADITVEFRKRTVTTITAKPESLSIHADHDANRAAAENGSISPLTAYLKETCSVQAAYDNGTKGTLRETASFTTADHFDQKGAVYRYTVCAGEKTCAAVLTVEPVTASVRNPEALTKTRKNGGYTAREVDAWLPEQVTVTYMGTGYTERAESLAVTWDTSTVGEDFGAALGEETVNGTATLPAWATGEDSVSIVIRFENKKPSSGGGDSGGGSGAAGNNGDGGSSDGNGGESGNGDSSSSDGNNGNTPENGAHPGAPAVTPPPAAAPQPPIRTEPLKQPQPETGRNNPGRSEGADQETAATAGRQEGQTDFDAETGGQTKEGTAGADSGGQPEDGAVQTVPAAVDDGRIIISGETVATGNLAENRNTVTRFEVGKGVVTVRVICDGEKCSAGVNDTVAVANTVLTSEQIELVNNGETIEIRIDVKDISDQVPGQDKETIENGIKEYQKEVSGLVPGMYVDISMFIRIGAGDWNAATETDEPVEVVIGIPETLQSDGREFFIIRAHEGECTLLRDLDDAAETITVSTDRFSSYAITYVEAEGTGAGSGAKCGLCHICPTFLGVCCFIWLVVITAAVIVAVLLQRRGRKEQEQKEKQDGT